MLGKILLHFNLKCNIIEKEVGKIVLILKLEALNDGKIIIPFRVYQHEK